MQNPVSFKDKTSETKSFAIASRSVILSFISFLHKLPKN